MKSLLFTPLLLLPSVHAWLPSCAWSDCVSSWSAGSCTGSSWSDCFCGNDTAIAQVNTCVATSCTNSSDQEAIYAAIAQNCANAGQPATASAEATFSATSGGTLSQITAAPSGWGPSGGWNSGSWSSWVSACSGAFPSAPSGWSNGPWSGHSGWGGPGGFGGPGGWGPGGGPWGTKASGVNCGDWTTWTAGWGPASSWTGIWSGCSSTTNTPAPADVTTTITTGGTTQVVSGTTFGVQALATTAKGSDNAASPVGASFVSNRGSLTVCAAVAGSVFGAMVLL